MDYLETHSTNFNIYLEHLENEIKKLVNLSMEREDMLKSLTLMKRVLDMIENESHKFKHSVINEFYVMLRKLQTTMNSLKYDSVFVKESNLKALKSCSYRNELYVREIIENLKTNKDKLKDKKVEHIFHKKTDTYYNFVIDIAQLKTTPNSCECIYSNMVQYKDEVYYIKTNDAFNYFYFYKNKKGEWFWSPPKKEDPEDSWFKVPITQIDKGYWADKKLPYYIEEFIIWLGIFNPKLPGENKSEDDKLAEKFSKLDQKLKNGKDCLIF